MNKTNTETKPFVSQREPKTPEAPVTEPKPFVAKAVESAPVAATLPVDFPGREVLIGAGLDTVDKVRLVFGDKGVNGETIAKIQLALHKSV